MIWAPYVKWEDAPVTMSADEAVAAMAGDAESRGALEEAKQFLLEVLDEGPGGPEGNQAAGRRGRPCLANRPKS